MDNWAIIKLFSYLRLRQSRVKQVVDMLQIQKCVTRNSSPYWCSVPNIRKLASVVPEKNVTEIFLWAYLPMSTIFKVASNRKWTCGRFKTALHDTVSILMLCAKYQEAGLCGSREKCDRNFLWRWRKTMQDDRSDPYMSPPLKRAGDTITLGTYIGHLSYSPRKKELIEKKIYVNESFNKISLV